LAAGPLLSYEHLDTSMAWRREAAISTNGSAPPASVQLALAFCRESAVGVELMIGEAGLSR
jgi:hypothetical protein